MANFFEKREPVSLGLSSSSATTEQCKDRPKVPKKGNFVVFIKYFKFDFTISS